MSSAVLEASLSQAMSVYASPLTQKNHSCNSRRIQIQTLSAVSASLLKSMCHASSSQMSRALLEFLIVKESKAQLSI